MGGVRWKIAGRAVEGLKALVMAIKPIRREEFLRWLRMGALRRDERYFRQWRDPRLRVSLAKVRWMEKDDD
jgi:hypothetical protein